MGELTLQTHETLNRFVLYIYALHITENNVTSHIILTICCSDLN